MKILIITFYIRWYRIVKHSLIYLVTKDIRHYYEMKKFSNT